MSEENPYAAPACDPTNPEALNRRAFPHMETKELNKLRNDSHSTRALAFLMVLGICLLLVVLGTALATSGSGVVGIKTSHFLIQGGLLALSIVTAVGLIKRVVWGRVLGFIPCSLMLLGFPIGTLIGLFCLVALARGARLFGPNRITHGELETEWKYRKRNKIS